MRAATETSFQNTLAPEQTAVFNLTTADIAPLNWDKVHVIALVDYRPQAGDRYDTLQAAVAIEGVVFSVTPDTVVYPSSNKCHQDC